MDQANGHPGSEKLLQLCEKQLQAVIEDSDSFFNDVTSKALALAGHVEQLKEMIGRDGDSELQSVFDDLDKLNNQFIISLQFFDEYSQRISHVMEAVQLVDEDLQMDQLTELVRKLFATRSEHELVNGIFGSDLGSSSAEEPIKVDFF